MADSDGSEIVRGLGLDPDAMPEGEARLLLRDVDRNAADTKKASKDHVGVVEGAADALEGAKSLSVYYCPICKVGTGDRAWHPVGRAGLIPQTQDEHTCVKVDVLALVADREALLERIRVLTVESDTFQQTARWHADKRRTAETRVGVLEGALRDEADMSDQSRETLRFMLKHWERLGRERTYDGEPRIEEELRGLIDDLDTSSARAVLAGGEAAGQGEEKT